jgi:hypothetical protein
MDQDIVSEINRAHMDQKAPAHIRIIKVQRNVKGAKTAITHQNPTAAMALTYCEVRIISSGMEVHGSSRLQIPVAVASENSWMSLRL